MKNNKIVKKIQRIGSNINDWLERLSAFWHLIIIIIVIFISTQAISFCLVYLQLLNEKDIFMPCFKYINIWGIVTSESITNELIYTNIDNVKNKIDFLINISVALSGILLSLVTFISYLRRNVAIRRKSCFKKKEIFKTGKDDINIMYDYFVGASFVAVYSHSFEWINKNDKIREILSELSNKNKLKLYTGDNVDIVKQRLQKYNNELHNCLQQSQVSLRFSYIERNNAKYLLYRQEENNHTYVIMVQENNESKYLLEVISQLVK